MSLEDQLSQAAQRFGEAAKAKAQEAWEYTRTQARLHAKLEWKRTQVRMVRWLRDTYDPPTVPDWIQEAVANASDDIELPMRADAEPFLIVPLRLVRRFEFERGWLSGRVEGQAVRFTLTPEFVETALSFHDPTIDIEMEEQEERAALEKLDTQHD